MTHRHVPTAYRREATIRGGPAPIPGCFALMWRTGLPERITSGEAADGLRRAASSALRRAKPAGYAHHRSRIAGSGAERRPRSASLFR